MVKNERLRFTAIMRRAFADQRVDAAQQARAQPPLAAQQRHRLRVRAHVHEVGAEARLAVGLGELSPISGRPSRTASSEPIAA